MDTQVLAKVKVRGVSAVCLPDFAVRSMIHFGNCLSCTYVESEFFLHGYRVTDKQDYKEHVRSYLSILIPSSVVFLTGVVYNLVLKEGDLTDLQPETMNASSNYPFL